MAEENKSIQSPQYYPTVNPGYKMSVGANGQGTVFDTNGNIFHFTSPDDDLQNVLQEANYQGNVELTADNRTMIAAGKDLLSTPFFKLNVLGSVNYETSDEELESNTFINPPPSNDPEVTYQKTGDIWEFKFNEQNRGISGFNLVGQSATGNDAIHQLSNVAANVVGSDLKQLFSNSKFYKVDMAGLKMEYGVDKNNKTYYYITIPLIAVKDDKSAYVNFEHKGSWSTTKRDDKTARQNALTNIYGGTPFDKSSTNGGSLDTWNFPVTNVNSTSANKGWPFFNTIKQNFPTYEFVEKTTGLDNNIYEFWFQWFDPSTIGKLNIPATITKTQVGEEDDELDVEGQIFNSLPFNENETPVGLDLGKAYNNEEEIQITVETIKDITFNIREIYGKQIVSNGGNYKSINDAVLASLTSTTDGQMFNKYMTKYVFPNEGKGGKAEVGDNGGLTTYGVTYDTWKKVAPIAFPGVYSGTKEELAALAKDPKGSDVMLVIAKVGVFDITNKGADNTVPEIFKIMALQDMWGGQLLDPTGATRGSGKWGAIWQNAKKRFDNCKGDVQVSFAVMWGWARQCGEKENPLFNLSGMPSPRWGMGWTKRVGVAWFTKDPATGKALPTPLPYKVLINGTFPKESVYAYYLNETNGVDFCSGRTADIYKLSGSDTFKGGKWKDLNTLTNYTEGKVTYSTKQGLSITWNGTNVCVNC